MDIDKLRFPIGKYIPGEIKFDDIEKWIQDISELPALLRELTQNVDDKSIHYTYRPEGWSIRQVIHHIADSHMNAFIRFKLALTEDNPTIKPYYEDRWAKMQEVNDSPIEASLLLLEGLHRRWTALLKDMNVKEFGREYTHPEHGRSIDLAFTVGMYSWHGRHHLAHIKNALTFKRAYWNDIS